MTPGHWTRRRQLFGRVMSARLLKWKNHWVGASAFCVGYGSGRYLAHRADERFAMCSAFKWVLAAAILGRAEHAELSLGEQIFYGPADLLEYAPVTRKHVAERIHDRQPACSSLCHGHWQPRCARVLMPSAFLRRSRQPLDRADVRPKLFEVWFFKRHEL